MAFSDLTERQNELLVQLMAHELRSGQANQEFRAIDFSQGWRILLSGPAGSELLSDFGETDLLALQARGYITLLRYGSGYNFTLTAKAYAQSAWVDRPALLPTHEAVRAAAASEPVVQPAGPAASPTISLQLHDDLRRSLISGNVCTFVGAGLSVGAGLPDWYNLIAELSAGIGCKLAPREWAASDALIDAAQAYVNRQGLHSLISHLKDRLDTTGVQPTAAHRALAGLPIPLIFTANFDDLLERAFRDAGKRVEVVVRDSSIPFMRRGLGTVNIVKLYGDLDQPDTIVLARQQYESYFLQRPQMVKLLEVELSRSDTLYLGWSGSDPHFKLVFGELLSRFGQMMRPGYAVMFDVTDDQQDELRRKQIRLVELTAGNPTASLAKWLESLVPPSVPPAAPTEPTTGKGDGGPAGAPPIVLNTGKAWAAKVRQRHTGDFTHLKEHDASVKAFERLTSDLKVAGWEGGRVMRRHVLYALMAVVAVALVVWGISVAIQPGVQEDWRLLLLLAGVVVMATVAVLGGLNNVTELVRKLWKRTTDDGRRKSGGGDGVEQVITARDSRLERVNQFSASAGSQRIEAEGSTLRDVVQNVGGTSGYGDREILELEIGVGGQRSKPDMGAPMTKELESLRRQLVEMEESLRLIEERKAAYVLEVDVPLTLVKEEQRLREWVKETKGEIRRLERGEPSDIGAPSNGKPTAPIGAAT